MLFLNQKKIKKRFRINVLKSILIVLFTICFNACSHTPTTTVSAAPALPAAPVTSVAPSTDASASADSKSTAQLAGADTDSIWQRIRDGYQFDQPMSDPRIDAELSWYRANPTFVYRATERANRYLQYVVSAVQQRNLPTELALLPFIESAYDPFAYSHSDAAGLWQFIPQTGTTFGLHRNWWYDGRKDVVTSTEAALDYLKALHDKFNGDWLLAIAAYNCGEGTLQRAIDANRRKGLATDFWHLNLREETRKYVPRLLAFAKIVKSPQNYGISLFSIPDRAYFAAADTKGMLGLATAARIAAVDIDELYRLNPGLNHATVTKETPQHLLLPVSAIAQFTRELAKLPAAERVHWQHYKVARGDTLSGIAHRFATTPSALASANDLGSTLLHPGQQLLIPQGSKTRTVARLDTPAPVTTQTPYGSTQIFYIVQSGDSLHALARRYGVSVRNIQRWNGLSSKDPIKLGQKLNIWTERVGSRPAKITAASTPKKVGYTVRNGDSLAAIANRFNIEADDILRWNQINPRGLLQPGWRLTLFLND